MTGTVNITFKEFFSPRRIEQLFPKALKALIELALRTDLNFTAIFHQIRCEDHPEVHEGIELHAYWEDKRFAVIYYLTSPEPGMMAARDYQFPHGRQDRQLPWATQEEGVSILATFLEPHVAERERFLGQRHRTLQELEKLHRRAAVA